MLTKASTVEEIFCEIAKLPEGTNITSGSNNFFLACRHRHNGEKLAKMIREQLEEADVTIQVVLGFIDAQTAESLSGSLKDLYDPSYSSFEKAAVQVPDSEIVVFSIHDEA